MTFRIPGRWLLLILLTSLFTGPFIVRTARLDRSAPAESVEVQYVLDKIEVDDRVALSGRGARSWRRSDHLGGTLEAALKDYGAAAHLPVHARWEALAGGGIRRDTRINRDASRLAGVHVELDWIVWSVLGEGADVAWRCRHQAIEISTVKDFDADQLQRRYPVADLLASVPADPSRDNEFLQTEVIDSLPDHSFGLNHVPPLTVRIDHGTLVATTTLENHVLIYERLQFLRRNWKTRGY